MDLKVHCYRWVSVAVCAGFAAACNPWYGETPDTLYHKARHGAELKAPNDLTLKHMSNFYKLPKIDAKAEPVSTKPPKGMKPKNDDFMTKAAS